MPGAGSRYLISYLFILYHLFSISLYLGNHLFSPLYYYSTMLYIFIILCITYSQSLLSHPTESKYHINLYYTFLLIYLSFTQLYLLAIGLCSIGIQLLLLHPTEIVSTYNRLWALLTPKSTVDKQNITCDHIKSYKL